MTKEEILAAAGFPNTPEGIAAFYDAYPDQGVWQQRMAYGGSPFIQGFPFGAGITMAEGGTPYYGGPIYPAQDGAQMPVKWPTFKTTSEHDAFVANDPNLSQYSSEDLQGLGLVKPSAPDPKAIMMQNKSAYTPAGTAPNNTGLFNNAQGQPFIFSNGSYTPYNPNASTPVVTKKYGGLPNGPHEYPMPCMNCGGYMEDGGNASPFNYGAFPAMQGGGSFDPSNNQSYPMLDNGGDYSWVDDTINQVDSKKKGGDTTEPGGNQDFLTERMEYVKKFMSTMVDKKIRQEESAKVKNAFIQMDSKMPPIGVPTNAYGGYKQMGGPGMINYDQPYDQINQQNEANGMMAQDKMASMNDNRTGAWQNMFGSFGNNSKDPNNFYAAEGKIVQNKNESWENYQERIREDKYSKEGGRGRQWDGTKWVKVSTGKASDGYPTEGYNPWANLAEAGNPKGQYSNYIPDNDIRTGFRFGKKDFKELSKLSADTKLTGARVNYGALGKIAPRIFGPKSVTFGTMGKYEDNMRIKDVPRNDLNNFKPSSYGDGQGPYPETERQPMKKPAEIIPPSADRQKAVLNMADPFNAHNVEMYNKMPKGPELDPFNNPDAFKQGPPRNGYGGLNKFVVGGPEDPDPIDIQPDYLQPKSSLDLFSKYVDNDPKNRMQATEDAGLRDPDTNSSGVYKEFTAKKKTTGVGKALFKRSALIADTLSSGVEQNQSTAKQRVTNSHFGMNRFTSNPNDVKNEGDYDINSGELRPDQKVVKWGGFNTMDDGGIHKAGSGLGVRMKAALYGTNGNNQFNHSAHLEAGKISQKPTETRDTLGPVARDGANLEAERGETAVVNIDGMPAHFKIGGNRHSQGGTPLNLPDNSFIFSDTAKMKIKDPIILAQFGMVPKKAGYTPAEIAKKYDINKFRKVLADPDSENVERKTAEMMIANYNLKLAKLALIQESMKGFPQGIPLVAMPYIIENELDASQFLPDQAEEQLEGAAQPDADTGEARYGANVISQWDTKRFGGLPKAQVGVNTTMDSVPRFDPALIAQQVAAEKLAAEQQGTMTTGSARRTVTSTPSFNIPLQIQPEDLQYTEPDWATKALQGLGSVLEFPQRATMYAGTSMFGDEHYKVINPKTGESEWVTKPVANIRMKQGYKLTTEKKTGFYEMPSETIERRYPDASPALKFASDVLVDPILPFSVWKTAGRLANKGISKAITKAVYKDELKNLTRPEAIEKILGTAKKTSNDRNIKIASDVLDKVENTYKNAPDIDERGLLKIAAPAAHNAAIAHDVKKVNEEVVKKTIQLADATVSRAKKIYEGAAPAVKKVIKGTKDVIIAAHNAIDDPIAGPAAKNLLRNLITQGSRYVDQSEKEKERELAKKEISEWKSAGVDATNKLGLFTNPKRGAGKFYFDQGTFKPFTSQVQDSLIKASKPQNIEIKNKPKTAPSATVAPADTAKTETTLSEYEID